MKSKNTTLQGNSVLLIFLLLLNHNYVPESSARSGRAIKNEQGTECLEGFLKFLKNFFSTS